MCRGGGKCDTKTQGFKWRDRAAFLHVVVGKEKPHVCHGPWTCSAKTVHTLHYIKVLWLHTRSGANDTYAGFPCPATMFIWRRKNQKNYLWGIHRKIGIYRKKQGQNNEDNYTKQLFHIWKRSRIILMILFKDDVWFCAGNQATLMFNWLRRIYFWLYLVTDAITHFRSMRHWQTILASNPVSDLTEYFRISLGRDKHKWGKITHKQRHIVIKQEKGGGR